SSWPTGYCARLDVTNGGDAAVSWQVTVPVDGTIYDHWNCDVSQSGAQATFHAAASDPPLAPGATSSVAGFCANL
ncbi:MAG: cellulose binding domain-containing protein, partial [Myxococcales bacterium]|nr:cellulose binding domain-containing protein [Myxococcales bacterium]